MDPQLYLSDFVLGVIGALAYIVPMSFVPEPVRLRFNAIFVAGAGAAYLSGGLGPWEFAYTAVATVVAYFALGSYRLVAAAWLLHVGWDVVHHLYGDPIVWCLPSSSAQCAVCDSVFVGWFLCGAPSLMDLRGGGR